jgi:hypothetical protein
MQTVEDRVPDIVAKETRRDRSQIGPDLKVADIDPPDVVRTTFAVEDRFDLYSPRDDESVKPETMRDGVRGIDDLPARKQSDAAGSS